MLFEDTLLVQFKTEIGGLQYSLKEELEIFVNVMLE